MRITKDHLDGKMDRIDYQLDFPYEVTQRYQKMCREEAEYAEMLYYTSSGRVQTIPRDDPMMISVR